MKNFIYSVSLILSLVLTSSTFAFETPKTNSLKVTVYLSSYDGHQSKRKQVGSLAGVLTLDENIARTQGDVYNAILALEGLPGMSVRMQTLNVDNTSLATCLLSVLFQPRCQSSYSQQHIILDKAEIERIALASVNSSIRTEATLRNAKELIAQVVPASQENRFEVGTRFADIWEANLLSKFIFPNVAESQSIEIEFEASHGQ